MSEATDPRPEELLSISLDGETTLGNRPARAKLLELLKTREANDPATRLFLRLLQDSDCVLRELTVYALLPRPDIAKTLLPDLIELLGHRNDRVKWAACQVLSTLGREGSPALPKLQELEPNSIVARAIWKTSGQTELVMPMLIKLMEDPTREGEEICDLVYEMGPDGNAIVPSLIRALKVDDGDLKWAVVDALGAIGPKAAEAVPALVEALNSPSGLVAGRAAIALGQIGAVAVPALIGALESDDARRREFAADALSQIGEAARSAAPHLQDLLNDPNPDVAGWTAVAIAKTTKDPSVVPMLIRISNETGNPYLREEATVALDEIVTQQKWRDQATS